MHFSPKKRFRFELFSTKIDGFEDAVREAWVCDDAIFDPSKRLDTLLRNTAQHLQAWGQHRMGNIKVLMAVANWIIFRFDQVQEFGRLCTLERWFRRSLKLSLLGLASVEHSIDRQQSRMKWLRDGDANTKLFQAVANGRRTNNFIPSTVHGSELITDQSRKEEVFADAFEDSKTGGSLVGRDSQARSRGVLTPPSWERLGPFGSSRMLEPSTISLSRCHRSALPFRCCKISESGRWQVGEQEVLILS
ncbi:hypothetical protein D1007_00841 [Hordeum vulgare]|nr:hypothetical protein D1007_00841 [Hordeum vulgare]